MTSSPSILLIGAGKMGGALLAAWLRSGIAASSVTVVDTHATSLPHQGVQLRSTLAEAEGVYDCVVLAVKPQSMDDVMRELGERYTGKRTPMFLSIAAGKPLAYFARFLPDAAFVRSMPNTPALVGKGISALVANRHAQAKQKQLAERLLAAAGATVWLEQEQQMDAVTAISGSGPAYMFLFLELLIDAGKAQGLSDAVSKQLAIATMQGSAELAAHAEESLTQLRKNVTSRGGTTEAALNVFMKNDVLKSLVHKAVWQAIKRAKELA